MKKLAYYLLILVSYAYFCVFFSHFVSYYFNGSALKQVAMSDMLGAGIFYLLVGIPYNISLCLLVAIAYYFNEIKRRNALFSFLLGLMTCLSFVILFAILDSNIRESKVREITFWDSLSFYSSSIFDFFKLFLIGIIIFTFVMIPIHGNCRKRFDFLNEEK